MSDHDIELRRQTPASARLVTLSRLKDIGALTDAANGVPLEQIAARHDLGSVRQARMFISRALARLDQRIIDNPGLMRAHEMTRLSQIAQALADNTDPGDVKAAAELRLNSESVRRLYGVDLEKPTAGEVQADIRILYSTPSQREQVVDGEFEEIEQIEAGQTEVAPDEAMEKE